MLSIYYYTIESHNIPLLKAWGKSLMGEYKAEAVETLEEENAVLEIVLLSGTDVIAINCYRGERRPTNMDRKLNREHRALFKRILVPAEKKDWGDAEVVYMLINNG